MDHKTCFMCNETKSFSCFVKDKTGKYGLRAGCKECNKSYKMKHYQ
jgi:transcription elongation factor Elf1